MKKRYIFIILAFISISLNAQIPYFAGTVGDAKLYGYTSLKFRSGTNAQETYTTFQYGIGSSWATGIDLYTAPNSTTGGVLLRYGIKLSPYFNIGAQATPTFDLNENMKFDHLTAALYTNGKISRNGNLFWCGNTWWGINRGVENTITQYLYLGYTCSMPNGHKITPMIGEIHSWKFDQDADIAAGFYYTIKNWNFYLWGNDFLQNHPRIVVGVDFVM